MARLATIDAAGYPHVTPVWFLWEEPMFYVTSYLDRPHLDRIRSNPRVGLVIDTEQGQRPDGERPNQQVRIIGDATVSDDSTGEWTRRIRRKYITGPERGGSVERGRAVVTVTPREVRAVASV